MSDSSFMQSPWVAAGPLQASAPSPRANGPGEVTVTFYKKYLADLVIDKDPWRDDVELIDRYVAQALKQEIERKMRSPDGLDADYFIQAQDYLDDWTKNVAIEGEKVTGPQAQIGLMLGLETKTAQRLDVFLLKEGGVWKIRRVSQAAKR